MAPRQLLQVDGVAGAEVPADDRGLLYGDGVFRTLRVVAGQPGLLERQLRKLSADAQTLALGFDEERLALLRGEIADLVAGQDGVLRITLTRGSGPRGYARPSQAAPRRILAFTVTPPPCLESGAVRVQLARTPLASSPALAGIKHLGRLEQVLAASEDAAPEIFDRLMCDAAGRPVCGTRCNLFLRRDRELVTPRLDGSGVAGLVRELLLEGTLPRASGRVDACCEEVLGLDDLRSADEVFVTNAVFGIRGVGELLDAEGRGLASPTAPGPLTAFLLEALVADFPVPGRAA